MSTDLEQANRYLSVLAPDNAVTYQTFDDKGTDRGLTRILHGTLEQHHKALQALNRRGAGVFVMVNEGDGKGRSKANVTRVRALFLDTDGAPYPDSLPLKPHLAVKSSPGRWHLYFLVDCVPLSEFAALQKTLAGYYGTDTSVCDLPRVMRLPGYLHCKADPVKVELLEVNEHDPYSRDAVLSAWPCLAEALEHERKAEAEQERRRADILSRAAERKANPTGTDDRDRAKALLQAHHDTVAAAGTGARHLTLRRSARALGGYVAGGYLDTHEVTDILLAAAEVCGLAEFEAEQVIKWALKNGADEPLELSKRDDKTDKQIEFLDGRGTQGTQENGVTPHIDNFQKSKPRSRRSRQIARLRRERHARAK